MALHVEQAELEHGEQPDRPCPDDQHICFGDFAHAVILEEPEG